MVIEVKVKENDYTCGTCKHYDSDECYCQARGEFEVYSLDGCEEWEEDKDELTDDEKCTNAGCDEAHRIMVEGREIE